MFEPSDRKSSATESPQATKKIYHAPQVRDYGDLQTLTQTTGIGGINDGGGLPLYAS